MRGREVSCLRQVAAGASWVGQREPTLHNINQMKTTLLIMCVDSVRWRECLCVVQVCVRVCKITSAATPAESATPLFHKRVLHLHRVCVCVYASVGVCVRLSKLPLLRRQQSPQAQIHR